MLTQKQKDIIKIIEKNPDFKFNQITKALGYSSVSSVHLNVQKLINKGYLKKRKQ